MLKVEDFNALSKEIVKLDDFLDELYNNLDDYSRKTISRRLRKVGERYIFLSKAIRRKDFPESIKKKGEI